MTRVDDVNTAGDAEAMVLRLVEDKRKADPALGYGQALKLVANENPTLFRKREALQTWGRDGVRFIAGAEDKKPKDIEEARAELKAVVNEFFGYVWRAMEGGKDFDAAITAVSKEHPELNAREQQLRGWIKALGEAYDSLAASSGHHLRASDVHTAAEAEAMVLQLVEDKRKAHPAMGYGQALKLVASENPMLFRRREQLQRGF